MKTIFSRLLRFSAVTFLLASVSHGSSIPIVTEIKNEQPHSVDNNAIRIRLFNNGAEGVENLSFCYQFHANKDFVFEDDWYLPHLIFQVDTLTDTTFQAHFQFEEGITFEPNTYFPNTSGIVFGLHYKDWSPWNYELDYSFSDSPEFVATDKVLLSTEGGCPEIDIVPDSDPESQPEPIDDPKIVLGFDKDNNGVRDDLDKLIDEKFPESAAKRASYKFFAKSIRDQLAAFEANSSMTYEELLPYRVNIALGLDLIYENDAITALPPKDFLRKVHNSYVRIMINTQVSEALVGKSLPIAVINDAKYADQVKAGMVEFQKILNTEMEVQ